MIITTALVVEWTAFGLGAIGQALWAAEYKFRGRSLESYFWLLSSLLWIVYAINFSLAGLALRDLIGAAIYIAAIWKRHKPSTIQKETT